MAITITVAEVAAVINVFVLLVQYTLPLVVALIAVAVLENTSNAATWSAFGNLINSTTWPALLKTDTASKRRVSRRIVQLSLVGSLASILMTVVSALTPLGLKSDTYGTDPSLQDFRYIRDTSPIGQGTTFHADYRTDRLCGGLLYINCPGSDAGFEIISNFTGIYAVPKHKGAYISSEIADNITDVFTSATSSEGNTVAGIFDIEYRSFFNYGNRTKPSKKENDFWIDQGRSRTSGVYHFFESLVLNDKIEAIEGLIVDTVHGGVGFRNHTLPPNSLEGTTWSEDLLWLEPVTECVDMNLTLDYTLSDDIGSSSNTIDARLTDRGGIANLPHDYPRMDLSHAQSEPVLWNRAWRGGLLTIMNILIYMDKVNATRKLGTTYKVVQDFSSPYAPNQLTFAPYGDSTSGPALPSPLSFFDDSAFKSTNFSLNSTSNPKYLDVSISTQGYGSSDVTDINTIGIQAGAMLGAGIPIGSDGQPMKSNEFTNRMEPLSSWSQPLFSCASAVKASVKTVNFKMEGDASIDNLRVESVKPKKYGAAQQPPTWAIEKTGIQIRDINPFWGIVDSSYSTSKNLQTVKADHFYIPAGMSAIWAYLSGLSGSEEDGYAGGTVPMKALAQIYNTDSTSSGTTRFPDYSGLSSYAMFLKWQKYSRNASTAGKVIDLIWTDLVANNLVGAKSLLSQNGKADAPVAQQTATVSQKGVQYNWLYAIPAFLLLALYLVLFVAAITFFFTRHVSFAMLRYLLNQTSAGRAVTAERYRYRDENSAPTRYWADTVGSEQISVSKQVPATKPIYETINMQNMKPNYGS